MNSQSKKQNLVSGGLLILFGAMALIQTLTYLSVWVWVAVLVVGGISVFGVYLKDRTEKLLLIMSYAMFIIAILVTLLTLNVLQGPFVASFVLLTIALPILVIFLQSDRTKWWLLIPVYVLLAIGVMVPLIETGILDDAFVATYVLMAIAIPFLIVFARNSENWWAIIPAFFLGAIGVMVPLIETGGLYGTLVAAYVLIAIAIPFFIIYTRDSNKWWALIPAGITAVIGLSFLIAEKAAQYVAPVILIIVGAWILAKRYTRKE